MSINKISISQEDIDELKGSVTEETFSHCMKIINEYGDLDDEEKGLAFISFFNAIFEDQKFIESLSNSIKESHESGVES